MSEEQDYARRALRLLDEEPDWPSIVDLDRAVVEGRRQVRRRTAVRITAAAVAVGLAAGGAAGTVAHRHAGTPLSGGPQASASVAVQAPTAPSACVAHLLPVPKGHQGIVVMGGDPDGRYLVGRSVDASGRHHPLLWTDGTLRDLDPVGTVSEVDGIAVNSSGTVAWSSGRTWLYRGGNVTPLTAADGYRVMRLDPAGGLLAVDGRLRLLSLPAGGAPAVRDLQALDPIGTGTVFAVGADGTAVGRAVTGTSAQQATRGAVWRADGSFALLPVPGQDNAARPMAVAGDWAGGSSWTVPSPEPTNASDPANGVRWNLTTGNAEKVPGIARVEGVNRYGWLVGEDSHTVPVAVLGDHVVHLPVPAGAEPIGSMAVTVSDDGRVVGGQVSLPDTVAAARWTCG